MAILSIGHEFAGQISYDEIIDEFAALKARKSFLKNIIHKSKY